MATFAEIENDVYEITARPDLVVLTRTSIRAAIVAAHSLQEWPRDKVQFVCTDYVVPPVSTDSVVPQFFDQTLPADYRSLNRVIADFGQGNLFDDFRQEQGGQLFLYSGHRNPFTWRELGNTVRIGYVGAPVQILLEYFAFPAVVITEPPSTTSWIVASSLHEYITIHAAQRVFRSLGMADDARMLDNNLIEARADLLASFS